MDSGISFEFVGVDSKETIEWFYFCTGFSKTCFTPQMQKEYDH
jgi:hypothetical protein